MLRLIIIIAALCAAAAGVTLIIIKYLDSLVPRYSYTRVRKLPDAFIPDSREDYI